MVSLLSRFFIKNHGQFSDPAVRREYGVLCGFWGIFLNIILFAVKFIAGLLSGSVAITADAFNNLSDAGSSVITLIGFKLSGKKPDPDHPFGHGRVEYIAGLAVSFIIILMGFELGKTSIEKILHPETIEFSLLPVLILALSILIKLYMSYYNRSIGKKIDSASMRATAADSLSDACATGAVLLSMIVFKLTSVNIDAWCGVLVSCLILIAGVKAAIETVSPLLGQPADPELVKSIRDIAESYPETLGIHDMIVHDYGGGRLMASLHLEVDAKGDILEIHDVIDNIERQILSETGCFITIHMDPIVTDDERLVRIREVIEGTAAHLDERITMHDLRMVTGTTHTNVIFDLVVPYDSKKTVDEVKEAVSAAVKMIDNSYFTVIDIDRVYTA